MKTTVETITINGVEYVSTREATESLNGMEYVIVRTCSAGVFAGYLAERKDKEVVLKKARRLWHWKGAASLSQLAMEGVSKPKECKFPIEMDNITLTEAIEIIHCTEQARVSIKEVAIWKA